jgi:pseudaminic acid cytidylyltransferase
VSAVAIIPARGGSKRIPDKNIKVFAGKPIIAYSIEAALASGLFKRVIVSTDSQQIAEISKKYGAEVPFLRPAELADDFTATVPVLIHALRRLETANRFPSHFCCIYATAPFLKKEYLEKGLELLKSKNATTTFSVTEFEYPVFRALRVESSGRVRMKWPKYESSRSNDLEILYHDAGQFYWGDTLKFIKEQKLFSDHSFPVILPSYQTIDIDSLQDWYFAERLFQLDNNHRCPK